MVGVSKERAYPARPARITWLGHSTVLVELDGVWLLTNPVLRDWVAHVRRTTPADARIAPRLDGILVSHLHYSKLATSSLELLGRSTPLVVPLRSGTLFRRCRFERVIEVDPEAYSHIL